MHGPIYILSNSKHNYSEPPKHSDLDTKNLKGPVYMTDEYKHHYNQIHEHLDTLKELKAPVYETEGKSHYNEIIQHVESLQSLKGPVYDLGSIDHHYTGDVLEPHVAVVKQLHGPRYDIDSHHHFSEIISCANKLKELKGPIYELDETEHHFKEMTKHVETLKPLAKPILVDERHSYGEESSMGQGVKLIHGPIYVDGNSKHHYSEPVKPSDLDAKTLKGPIYYINEDDYKHHYNSIQEHIETLKDLKAPIYNVEGKNHYLEIIKHVESLKSLQGPVYDLGPLEHKYTGDVLEPAAVPSKQLHGPKYAIESEHHFSEIISCANKLKELKGPIYNLDETEHHFREMTKHVESLIPLAKPIFVDERHSYGEESTKGQGVKLIHGPVYVAGNVTHHYSEPAKSSDLDAKTLKGPIYFNDDYKHHYNAIQEHIETLKDLKAPIYNVEGKNHYSEIIKHVESLKSLQGPIYDKGPLDHKYTGDVLEPAAVPTKQLHGPKYDIDSEHRFSEIISCANKLKELKGPIYNLDETEHHFREMTKHVESLIPLAKPIFVDERHSYGEESTKGQGVKLIHGPVYVAGNVKHHYSEPAKSSDLDAKTLKGPIYINDEYRHHCNQIQEHMETLKELKGPIYNVESKSHYLEIIKHVENLKALQGPIYDLGPTEHKYTGSGNVLEPQAVSLKHLHGPRYDIDSHHHFSEIISQANKLKELKGPVYDLPETEFHFNEILKHVEDLKPLAKPIFVDEKHCYGEESKKDQVVKPIHGPVYVAGNVKHHYSEQPKPAELQTKNLKGPIYQNDGYRHQFNLMLEHIDTLKTLQGPIYEVEGKSHYLEIIKCAETLKDLKGPIYEFGEVGHKYTGTSTFVPDDVPLGTLHGPKYSIDRDHQFSEIMTRVDNLKNLSGPVYELGDTEHHFREIKKHVESLATLAKPIFIDEKHQYGEVSNRDAGVKLIHRPIYMDGSAKHHYQEPSKPAELQNVTLQGPIYFNSEDYKHNFKAIEQNVETLKQLAGPIYDVMRQHQCLLVKERPDQEKAMKGPIYEFGKIEHQFTGNNYSGADKGQNLTGPVYKIDDPAHHFDVILDQVKTLKELKGPVYDIELEHHFNEISKRISGVQQLLGPIYQKEDEVI